MERPTKPGFTAWLAANSVIVAAVIGACFYGAVRYAQKSFYDDLGLTPEDIGLGRIETLATATGLAFEVALVAAVFVGIPALGYWGYRKIDAGSFGPPERFMPAALLAGVLFCAVATVFFMVVWFHDQAIWAAGRVKAGRQVRLSFVSDTGIHADRANITWVGEAPGPLTDMGSHRLMYLGAAGGSVVLYDVDEKRSLRIPSGNVVVSIRP